MQPIYIGKRHVGNLRPDGTHISFRLPNHFFIKYNGFGISYNVLDQLRKLRAEKIIILYQDADQIKKYTTTLAIWLKHSTVWRDGNDYQRILPLKYFNQ